MPEPRHPGEFLRAAILPALQLSDAEVAKRLGVSRGFLSVVLQGRMAMSANFCLRLSKLTGTDAAVWKRMQSDYDLWFAQKDEATQRAVEAVDQVATL